MGFVKFLECVFFFDFVEIFRYFFLSFIKLY